MERHESVRPVNCPPGVTIGQMFLSTVPGSQVMWVEHLAEYEKKRENNSPRDTVLPAARLFWLFFFPPAVPWQRNM